MCQFSTFLENDGTNIVAYDLATLANHHYDVIKWKQFPRYTGLLCREFTGHRWIIRTKAGDAELWCWSVPE